MANYSSFKGPEGRDPHWLQNAVGAVNLFKCAVEAVIQLLQ